MRAGGTRQRYRQTDRNTDGRTSNKGTSLRSRGAMYFSVRARVKSTDSRRSSKQRPGKNPYGNSPQPPAKPKKYLSVYQYGWRGPREPLRKPHDPPPPPPPLSSWNPLLRPMQSPHPSPTTPLPPLPYTPLTPVIAPPPPFTLLSVKVKGGGAYQPPPPPFTFLTAISTPLSLSTIGGFTVSPLPPQTAPPHSTIANDTSPPPPPPP